MLKSTTYTQATLQRWPDDETVAAFIECQLRQFALCQLLNHIATANAAS